jgi:hypothetical protein
VVGAINDAVFRAEDLGEALEQVGLQMLEYWAQEAMWKPLVTQGMDFGTQLLGNVAGSLAGSWFGGGSAGSAAGDLNPAMASIAHAGGVAGRDISDADRAGVRLRSRPAIPHRRRAGRAGRGDPG